MWLLCCCCRRCCRGLLTDLAKRHDASIRSPGLGALAAAASAGPAHVAAGLFLAPGRPPRPPLVRPGCSVSATPLRSCRRVLSGRSGRLVIDHAILCEIDGGAHRRAPASCLAQARLRPGSFPHASLPDAPRQPHAAGQQRPARRSCCGGERARVQVHLPEGRQVSSVWPWRELCGHHEHTGRSRPPPSIELARAASRSWPGRGCFSYWAGWGRRWCYMLKELGVRATMGRSRCCATRAGNAQRSSS